MMISARMMIICFFMPLPLLYRAQKKEAQHDGFKSTIG
jgi:hypothetical protein